MRIITGTITLLLVAALSGCGGAATRQERAGDRAEKQTDEAERKADRAEETEEVIKGNSPEAVEDANDILEATPPAPAPKRER